MIKQSTPNSSNMKSDNIQYTLVCWFAGTNDTSDVPSITFFFIISCKILCKNRFNLFFNLFYKFTKIQIKSFECLKSIRNHKEDKKNSIISNTLNSEYDSRLEQLAGGSLLAQSILDHQTLCQ